MSGEYRMNNVRIKYTLKKQYNMKKSHKDSIQTESKTSKGASNYMSHSFSISTLD